jgi:hypothetical protein
LANFRLFYSFITFILKAVLGAPNFAFDPKIQKYEEATPPPPFFIFVDKGVVKGFPMFCMSLLRGWGRCLKVTLQTHVTKDFRSRLWGDE